MALNMQGFQRHVFQRLAFHDSWKDMEFKFRLDYPRAGIARVEPKNSAGFRECGDYHQDAVDATRVDGDECR